MQYPNLQRNDSELSVLRSLFYNATKKTAIKMHKQQIQHTSLDQHSMQRRGLIKTN